MFFLNNLFPIKATLMVVISYNFNDYVVIRGEVRPTSAASCPTAIPPTKMASTTCALVISVASKQDHRLTKTGCRENRCNKTGRCELRIKFSSDLALQIFIIFGLHCETHPYLTIY